MPELYQQICGDLIAGKKTSDIARIRNLKASTVRHYIRKAQRLSNMGSRAEFIAWVKSPPALRGSVMVTACDHNRYEVWPQDLWKAVAERINLMPREACGAILDQMRKKATPDICDEIVACAAKIKKVRGEA